jgi:hypothetical protein
MPKAPTAPTSRPVAPKQQPPPIQRVNFTEDDFKGNVARFNTIMAQLTGAVQALQGSGGRTSLVSGLEMQGETVSGLGSPQGPTDAVSSGHVESNYGPDTTSKALDIGGSNCLKGLAATYGQSQLNSTAITAIQAILAKGTGISGTLIIPKLTTANGSLTFVNGIITAFTQPT